MILGRFINFEKYFMELEIKPHESYLLKNIIHYSRYDKILR
jgi:hypothetical protein